MKPSLTVILVAQFLILAACASAPTGSSDIVAQVNGQPITTAELDRRYAQGILGASPVPTPQEADDLKLQLLTELISNEILLQLAEADGLETSEEEVDDQFDQYRNQYSDDRFQDLLGEQRVTVDELRAEMRKTMTIEKLVNKEITSKIFVTDAEIEDFYNRNVESFVLPETFHFAHILTTPVPDQGINNTEGDDATTTQQATEKATRLLGEVQAGNDFAELARGFSEDPSTAMNGGDLGYQPADAISAVDPALLEAVLELRVGETLRRVVVTRFGYHVVKLIGQDPGGQKDLSDPAIEAQIRQIIFNGRDQVLRGAFYETAHNAATVENFFARRILERATVPQL